MNDEILKVHQTTVAQALAADYFCIYYVNLDDDTFIEYSASPEYEEFGLPVSGDDFMSFSRKNFEELVHFEDRERFLETFTKENVVASLEAHSKFTMDFRMLFGAGPMYVHLKITRMIEKEGNHVVIGISNIDDQMKAMEAYEKAHHASITYNRIAQALAGDYFSIYLVDLETDHFMEYSATDGYERLGVEKEGGDFFNISRQNMNRIIYDEDRERFMGIFTKERIMEILERDGSFTMKYRLMIGDDPVFVSMKATLLDDENGRHLVIGTNNIDAQMKRERDYKKRMADARNRAKNDFLANMSHDIRTPMNAIVGYTHIASSHLEDQEIVKNSLEKIGSSSHFLLSLINDVLDMSKIESGKMQLNVGDFDLAEVLKRIEDITSLKAKEKALIITYQKDSVSHFHLRGDELRIEQILINIISNAIKYTPEGRSVELIAEEFDSPESGKNRYRFTVRDTGIGISEDYLPHIFDSFTREQNTTINKIQGTGLGLAITAKVVEQMGGTISVKSEVGVGSEFSVVLDLESLDRGVSDEANDTENSQVDLTGKRILIVEDNDVNAEIAAMVLTHFGMEADRAENGEAGLEKIQQAGPEYYDAVLMDIQMPHMNGYEATRAIRNLEGDYFRTVPIIAMSANAYEEDVRDCLDAGMNAHIAKPFNPGELIEMLRGHLV